jgi:small subunit ribosomal protein S20
MANKKAAKKAAIQSQRRALENSSVRSKLKTLAKRLRVSVEKKTSNTKNVQQIAIEYASALDKATKRNIVHRNFANRRKSNVAQYLFV